MDNQLLKLLMIFPIFLIIPAVAHVMNTNYVYMLSSRNGRRWPLNRTLAVLS